MHKNKSKEMEINFKFLGKIGIILFFVLLCASCQNYKDKMVQNKLEPFDFEKRDTIPSILGYWKLHEHVAGGEVIINKFDKSKMLPLQLRIKKREIGVLSKQDSLDVFKRVDLWVKNLDDFYLNFYSHEKVKAGTVHLSSDSLIKYKAEGFYEYDARIGKVRIEIPPQDKPYLFGGGYHYCVYKNQLRLYRNYNRDKNTYYTFYRR